MSRVKKKKKKKRFAVLMFGTGPCPVFSQLQRQFANEVDFVSYDVIDDEQIARQYNVLTVPTFVFIQTGGVEGGVEVLERVIGHRHESLRCAVLDLSEISRCF